MELTPEVIGWLLSGSLPVIWLFLWPFVAALWSSYVFWFVWKQFMHKKCIDPSGKAVFVTGCDSGFGYHVAVQLAREGFLVFAGCLHPHAHNAMALRDFGGGNVKVLDLDITSDEKVKHCAQEIERVVNDLGMNGLWAIYNNAGVTSAGEVEWTSMDEYARVANVNLWGTVRVTKGVLPLIRQARGRVVTVSSGIARSTIPGRSAYSISKYGVEAFMDALRYEMSKFDVKVITISPGNFTAVTNIFSGLDQTIDRIQSSLDERTRSDYGEAYLEAFRDKICGKYRSAGGSIGVQAVVNAIKDAILMENPRVRFKPMQPGWILWSFLVELLPYELTDKYIAFTERHMPKPNSS